MSYPSICFTTRQKLGLTQGQFADLLGITSRQISKIENLTVEPTKQTLLAMECLLRRAGLFGEEQQAINFE